MSHAAVWTPAYIAIGSNQDGPLHRVRNAFAALAQIGGVRVVAKSGIYRSPPLGGIAQPDFYNAVAGVITTIEPLALLDALKALEQTLGRTQPIERWGPRVIDFDLTMYKDTQMQTERLQLPHPGLSSRAFVLVPLAEIAPLVRVPGSALVADLARACDRGGLARVGE